MSNVNIVVLFCIFIYAIDLVDSNEATVFETACPKLLSAMDNKCVVTKWLKCKNLDQLLLVYKLLMVCALNEIGIYMTSGTDHNVLSLIVDYCYSSVLLRHYIKTDNVGSGDIHNCMYIHRIRAINRATKGLKLNTSIACAVEAAETKNQCN